MGGKRRSGRSLTEPLLPFSGRAFPGHLRPAVEGEPLRRGRVETPPHVRPRSWEHLGVTRTDAGTWNWPRYTTQGNELGQIARANTGYTIRGFSTIERQRHHVVERVVNECLLLESIGFELARISNYVLRHGVPTEPEMRTRLTAKLQSFSDQLPKHPRKPSKKGLKKKIGEAARMATDNRPTAMIGTLNHALNDVGIRLTWLYRQHPRLAESYQKVVRERREVSAEQRRDMQKVDERLRAFRQNSFPRGFTAELVADAKRWAGYFSRAEKADPTLEGGELARRYSRVATLATSNPPNWREVQEELLHVRRWRVVRFSRNFFLKAAHLRGMEKWEAPTRLSVVHHQAQLLEANIEHFVQHRNVQWVSPWLWALAEAMRPDPIVSLARGQIVLAANQAGLKKYDEAQKALQSSLSKWE